MSITFQNTDKQQAKITAMNSQYSDIISAIEPYDAEDADSIRKLQSELVRVWQNFTDQDRKLNITVVGSIAICSPEPPVRNYNMLARAIRAQ